VNDLLEIADIQLEILWAACFVKMIEEAY